MELLGKLWLSLALGLTTVACAASDESLPGPDAGFTTGDDISGSECVPKACEPNWCEFYNDGCGEIIDCGECGPDGIPGGDTGDEEIGDDDPVDTDGSCVDRGETDSADSPRSFGRFDEDDGGEAEETIKVIWEGEPVAVHGSDHDFFSMALNDTYDDGNPIGGFTIKAPETTTDLKLVLTVECDDPDVTTELLGCLYDGTVSGNSCVLNIPAGSESRTVDITWNCTEAWGTTDETATLTAEVMSTCSGAACDACQVYEVGARINDQDD